MKLKWILLSFLMLSSTSVFSSEWTRVHIPEAKCGDGEPYSIFLQRGESDKVLFEFMGGGACWDYKTCFNRFSPLPWLKNIPMIKSYSVFTANNSTINPFKNHSKVYFPYCTGDVFAGDHVGRYSHKGQEKIVHHSGRKNVELALEYLRAESMLEFSSVDDLIVYGASAGAIASLIHGLNVGDLFPAQAQKLVVVDSPGLHFGKTFWSKFDQDMKDSFDYSFRAVGLEVDFADGAVSKNMGPVFENYQRAGWKMAVLIGLQDLVMSTVFGDITPQEQKNLVLSESGLPQVGAGYSNVKFWIKDTKMHTFMLSKISASLKSEEGIKAHDFINNFYFEGRNLSKE